MRARVRSAAAPAASVGLSPRALAPCGVLGGALTAALVLSGCGGDDKAPVASPPPSTPRVAVPSAPSSLPPAPGQSRLPAVPKVKAADVKNLVGRWVSPAGDYFQFKADGTGSWTKGGQSLWNGQVIPEGRGKFRFSWQGGDPKDASYWGATLTGDGKLLFAGTNQTYTRTGG